MQVTIWKNDKESNERCITRFNKKVQSSRKLNDIRAKRYRVEKPTKRHVRAAAVMREKYRADRERKSFY